MKYRNALGMAFVGLISGIISSSLLVNNVRYGGDGLGGLLFSGLVFGILIGCYSKFVGFDRDKKPSFIKLIFFILGSTVSNVVAVLIAFVFGFWGFGIGRITVPFGVLLGGLIGTKLLLSSFNKIYQPRLATTPIIIIGTLLSVGAFIPQPHINFLISNSEFLYLPIIWQFGMSLSLGWFIDNKEQGSL